MVPGWTWYGAKRPWLSLWESCQPNRLTERVLRLMVESVYWNVGPSQTAPYGAASSPKGRAKVASLRTMSNKIPFIGTPSRPTWREANSLPYGGLSKNLPAKLQFVCLMSKPICLFFENGGNILGFRRGGLPWKQTASYFGPVYCHCRRRPWYSLLHCIVTNILPSFGRIDNRKTLVSETRSRPGLSAKSYKVHW